LIRFLFILLLLPACATDRPQRSQWDYMQPKNVKCKNYEMKLCRQFGPHLICECVKKRDFRAYV